jgi:hypothetical protein
LPKYSRQRTRRSGNLQEGGVKAPLTAKNLKPKKSLTKEYLDHLAQLERLDLEASRAKNRSSQQIVQMSIRMRQDAYFAFRALCRATRKTNGEMVAHLLETFLEEDRGT